MINQYLTYAEYTELGGAVDQAAFPKLLRKAKHILDYYTQDRVKYLTTVPAEVKEALTEVIDKLDESGAQTGGERVTSYSNGKVTMSFDVSQTEMQKLHEIIVTYLPLSLTRRGVNACT